MLKSGGNNLRSLLETPLPPIKDNDNLFSNKRLSVEPSFRILYYGGASGAVPFTWESQPGTPKHTFSDTSLPPLTPPPSYQSPHKSLNQLNRSKSSFLRTIFSSRKSSRHVSPSFSWSSSSRSSGSYSSPSTPMNWSSAGSVGAGKAHFVRSRSVVRFGVEEEKDGGPGGHVEGSAICFGVVDGVSKKFHGRVRMNKVKNALMSIVGHVKA